MRFEEDWQSKEITINRREFANIIAEEIISVQFAMEHTELDEGIKNMVNELLLTFSASVAAEVFSDDEER